MYYKLSCPSVTCRNRHKTLHHIGIRLACQQYNTNKQLLRPISAPGYGISLSYSKIILWDTRLANTVQVYIAKNDGIFIPFGLRKGSIVCFRVEHCKPPSKGAFQRSHGLKSFSPTDIENVKNVETKK